MNEDDDKKNMTGDIADHPKPGGGDGWGRKTGFWRRQAAKWR